MFIGIDPGNDGCIAILKDTKEVIFIDIDKQPAIALHKLKSEMSHIDDLRGVHIVMEKVTSYGMGLKSAFTFGYINGLLKGCCITLGLAILTEPVPTTWKSAVGIAMNPPKRPGKGATEEQKKAYTSANAAYKRDQKIISRNRCAELYPETIEHLTRAKDADRAEALLLAHYGRLKLGIKN